MSHRQMGTVLGVNLVVILWGLVHGGDQVNASVSTTLIEQVYFSGFLYVLFRPGKARTALVIANGVAGLLVIWLLWKFGLKGMDFICGLRVWC